MPIPQRALLYAECSALPHAGCKKLCGQEPVAQFPAGAGCSLGSSAQKATPAFSSTNNAAALFPDGGKQRIETGHRKQAHSYIQPVAFSVRLRVFVTQMFFRTFLLEFCSGFGFFTLFLFAPHLLVLESSHASC